MRKKSKHLLSGDISNLLKEIIEPENVDTNSIKINDELSPNIWDNDDKMNSEVRKKLLKNAKAFIEFSGLENLKFKDITLTGSLANYNYNENSDLDVHVVLDYNQISENPEFVEDYFSLKKSLWNDKLSIKVMDHDVELYYQNAGKKHYSSGIYSLLNDKWLIKPTKKIINIDTENLKIKTSDFMNSIDDLETNNNDTNFLERYQNIKDKIKKYRQSGLSKNGEYSIENLVFKVLRNTGYLEKMVELKNNFLTKELSLEEFYR